MADRISDNDQLSGKLDRSCNGFSHLLLSCKLKRSDVYWLPDEKRIDTLDLWCHAGLVVRSQFEPIYVIMSFDSQVGTLIHVCNSFLF
jgi:hypothetical protein